MQLKWRFSSAEFCRFVDSLDATKLNCEISVQFSLVLFAVFTSLCVVVALQNIQSTNWQTLRFKPPPPGTDIGWRVEFRPTEVRLLILSVSLQSERSERWR